MLLNIVCMDRLHTCLVLAFLILSGVKPCSAQTNKCPSTYFALTMYDEHPQYLLSLQVNYNGTQRLACVQAEDLYAYCQKYQNTSSKLDFISTFTGHFYRGIPLASKVPLDSLVRFGFAFTIHPDETDAIAQKGENYFISYYFNKFGCLRQDRKVNDASVMKHLQNWCIWAFWEHETGCLVVDSKAVAFKRPVK